MAPAEGQPPLSKHDVYDWLAELANQFLGRIANSLSTKGLELSLSTPSILTGDLLDIVQSNGANTERHAFVCGDTRFYVCVDVKRVPGAVFPVPEKDLPSSTETNRASEGDAVLF